MIPSAGAVRRPSGGALITNVRVTMNMTRAVCILLAMCSLTGCGIIGGIKKQHAKVRTKETSAALKMAIDMYYSEFGSLPQGQNETVTAILAGKNPKGILFLDGKHVRTNSIGQLLDGWGTPFKIEVVGSDVSIYSAGADRTFGTADDPGKKTKRAP